jgi:hypothetical protein
MFEHGKADVPVRQARAFGARVSKVKSLVAQVLKFISHGTKLAL